MSKNLFLSHFLVFQINTTIFFIFVTLFYKMAAGGHFAFWMSEKSLSVAFLDISDKYKTFFFNFYKMATGGILDVRNSLLIAFLAISDQYATLFFLYLYFCDFFTKWLPAAILNVRKSLSVAILAISDKYKTFILCIFTKWPPAPILDVRNSLSSAFLAISDQYATLFSFLCYLFYKMAAGGHFGCPKITFGRISDHFRSI